MVRVSDSAPAPSSSSGQGASLAIESAIELARCLRDLPYEQAFAEYEASGARASSGSSRRPRARTAIRPDCRASRRLGGGVAVKP